MVLMLITHVHSKIHILAMNTDVSLIVISIAFHRAQQNPNNKELMVYMHSLFEPPPASTPRTHSNAP